MGEGLVWLLLIVHLGGDPVSINRGEVAETFMSVKACEERIKEIVNIEEPPEGINLGCISYPKRSI